MRELMRNQFAARPLAPANAVPEIEYYELIARVMIAGYVQVQGCVFDAEPGKAQIIETVRVQAQPIGTAGDKGMGIGHDITQIAGYAACEDFRSCEVDTKVEWIEVFAPDPAAPSAPA